MNSKLALECLHSCLFRPFPYEGAGQGQKKEKGPNGVVSIQSICV